MQIAMTERNGYKVLHFKVDKTADLSGLTMLTDKSIDNVVLHVYKRATEPTNARNYLGLLLNRLTQRLNQSHHDTYMACMREAGLVTEIECVNDDVAHSLITEYQKQGDKYRGEISYSDGTRTYVSLYRGTSALDDYEIKLLLDIVKEHCVDLEVET